MKRKALILGAAILFVFGSTTLLSCKNKEHNNSEASHEHNEGMEHSEEMAKDDDHAEGEEDSHDGGDHMAHMDDVRDWLKKELGDQYSKTIAPATNEQLAMGKQTFNTICATCHGVSGKGDGPASEGLATKPADFTDPSHSAYYSDMGRIHIIKNGVEGTPMVGWSGTLSEKEIMAVHAYCRSLRSTDLANDVDLGDGMYTCSMHSEVSGNKGGKCPVCGMTLVAKEQEHQDDGHSH